MTNFKENNTTTQKTKEPLVTPYAQQRGGGYRFYNGITCFKDFGPCFGMNGHPRRDTDVISRRSKSTIDNISFYIGFTMEVLASGIKDLVLA